MEEGSAFGEPELIFGYSREQAIQDGVLVDVTETAREAGFKWKVASTCLLWAKYVTPSEELIECGQSERGRLWDVLCVLRHSILAEKCDMNEIRFKVLFLMESDGAPELVELKSVVGPGDNGEPVITIMLPYED